MSWPLLPCIKLSLYYDIKYVIIALLFPSIVLCSTSVKLKYGDVCHGNYECADDMMCQNYFCSCKPEYNTIQVFTENNNYNHTECKAPPPCSSDTERLKIPSWCRSYSRDNHGECRNDQCRCNGHLSFKSYNEDRYGTHYLSYTHLFSSCVFPYNGLKRYCSKLSICDVSVGLICTELGCICREGMMYDFEKRHCVNMTTYMIMNLLDEYKVNHGVYCTSDDDCMVGLQCHSNMSCSCAYPCDSYIREKESCDCGEEYSYTPILQIILGVLFGFFSVIFWCAAIAMACPDLDDDSSASSDSDNERCALNEEEQERDCVSPPTSNTTDAAAVQDTLPTAPPISVYTGSDDPPSYSEVMSTPKSFRDADREKMYQNIPLESINARVQKETEMMDKE